VISRDEEFDVYVVDGAPSQSFTAVGLAPMDA
jgi:hypothetical protein